MLKSNSHESDNVISGRSTESPVPRQGLVAPQWSKIDTYLVVGLSLVAVLTRFWHLDQPPTLVWDEKWTVWLARGYLQNEPFRDTHPPLTALLVATCIKLFGDQAWSWRLPSAIIGSALVAVTYLLGKRLFDSRLASTFAAALVLLDGLFLVESRFAIWEIYYVTFAAIAYLFLFQFIQNPKLPLRRPLLVVIGACLGLALSSKFVIPAVTELLVLGTIIFAIYKVPGLGVGGERHQFYRRPGFGRVLGIIALVGGVSALVYVCVYLPNYWLGWWRGVSDQIASYHDEVSYQSRFVQGSHQYASPWWSWPLMLRPVMFWTRKEFLFTADAQVSSIRALGNPFIWSGAMISILVLAADLWSRFNLARAFLVIGYALYLAAWAAIPRYHFIYHYMPSLYLGVLALAVVLSECWSGTAGVRQQIALLIAIVFPIIVGFDAWEGIATGTAITISYCLLRWYRTEWAERFVVASFSCAALFGFFYFLPLWTGTPLSRSEFANHLWLQGSGLANWL